MTAKRRRIPRISHNSNKNWANNAIQFPRLLAEILATVHIEEDQRQAICQSMDITSEELDELFDRAEEEWRLIKERT